MKQRRELLGVVLVGILAGCSGTGPMTDSGSGGVESRGLAQMQRPMLPGSSAQGQSNAQLPTYPQKFEVQGPEADSFVFAVTQPGSVVVDVQSQGAPVIVTLQGPAPQPMSQQGAGPLRLAFTVTPQDVQKGVLWSLQIRLAQPAPPQQGGRAAGSVMVQHPPVNQAMVQQAVQTRAMQQKQPSPQEQQQASAQAAAQMEQAFQQRKAQFDRQQLDRRAALHAQIQPQLDQLRSRMAGQVRPRGVEGGEGTSGEAGTSTEGEIGTRALRGERLLTPLEKPPVINMVPVPQTSTSQQAVTQAGSGPAPQTVMPNPAITSLSVAQGQPGDPVMITGSGFGTGGEVHFVIAPGKDLVAPAGVIWTDSQIFSTVPDATGVLGFNGTVYIKRASDNVTSNLLPFRFNPALETREIRNTMDRVLKWPVNQSSPANEVQRASANFLAGFKDNDVLFGNTRLKNGWVADEAFVYCLYQTYGMNFCTGGAYVWETKKGTDWPYLNVRWWMDPAPFANYSHVYYSFAVRIVGPKGVPDGVVVP